MPPSDLPEKRKRLLHSRYNPDAEAKRFVDSLDLKDSTKFFILIEPGLGYMIPRLRQRIPGARILSLNAERGPQSDEEVLQENPADASWHPEESISLQHFLENEIPDIEAGSVKIVEWRPAINLYGEAYLRILSEAAEFIKRADANFRTAGAFGRRWFRNFFRNLMFISECVCPAGSELPVVVAGAGPSLEGIIPILREEKQKAAFILLAVSSSVAALKAGGLEPDIAVSTDGGGWALLHLAEYLRHHSAPPEKKVLAAAMNAALPSQAGCGPVLVISDGSLWQGLILQGLEIPFISLPQRGTVSASALDLAFFISSGKIFLCGVDLGHRDLLTHARPYSFDRLWEEKENRFAPCYSQVFCRSSAIEGGGSHGIYASWFSRQLETYPKRLYSLGDNNPVFKGLSVSSFQFEKKPGSQKIVNHKIKKLDGIKNRPVVGAELLMAALEEPDLSQKISAEIKALLFPGGDTVSLENLKKEILSVIRPCRSLCHGY